MIELNTLNGDQEERLHVATMRTEYVWTLGTGGTNRGSNPAQNRPDHGVTSCEILRWRSNAKQISAVVLQTEPWPFVPQIPKRKSREETPGANGERWDRGPVGANMNRKMSDMLSQILLGMVAATSASFSSTNLTVQDQCQRPVGSYEMCVGAIDQHPPARLKDSSIP